MELNERYVYSARVPGAHKAGLSVGAPPRLVFFFHQPGVPGNQWSVEGVGFYRVVPKENAQSIFRQLGGIGCQLVELDRARFEEHLQQMKKTTG